MVPGWFIPSTLLIVLLAAPLCRAQLCLTTHVTNLYCLIPAAFHTESAPFNALFTPFGTELSDLPTAKPAGLVLKFEHGVLVPSNESLGAIFTERPESLGKHRMFIGATYQQFFFSTVDGIDMKHIPIVLFFSPLNVYTVSQNRIDIRATQYTALGAFGLTDRIDLSVVIPFERISMSAFVNGNEYGPGGATAPVNEYVPGTSSGLADVVFGAKAMALERKRLRLAGGLDVRVPSGDELNFLGSGAIGFKPYLAVSMQGRFSPHGNFGYQWNGKSILNANSIGEDQPLPADLFYTAGVNVEPGKRWALITDLLGKRFFNTPRLAPPTQVMVPGYGEAPSVEPRVGSYVANDLAVGFKMTTYEHLILTANATIKLNEGGLRSRVVPLAGLSYSF
jgi:hypothetical protein